MPRQKGPGGGRRRPPTRGRPREPETQADTQDNTQPPAQPPAAARTSPAWLAAHFENVARRPQPTSERSGYETVRVVAARDADAENWGGELQISDGRHTCRVLVPPTVDAGQPLESTVGTLLRLHGARVVVDRTHAPPRRGRDRGRAAVFGLALTCADLEPVDNAAIEADDEQRPDVDADGHVSALLRASAGRATLRAAAATLDEHQPGGAAATEDAGLLGMDVAPLRRSSPRSRRPRPRPGASPALAGAPRDAAPAPARSPARRTPRNSPQRRRTPRTPASPPPPRRSPADAPGPADARPGRADARDGGAPRRGAARGRAAEEAGTRSGSSRPRRPGTRRRPRSSRARASPTARRPESRSRAPSAGRSASCRCATTRGSARRPSPRPPPTRARRGRRPRRRRSSAARGARACADGRALARGRGREAVPVPAAPWAPPPPARPEPAAPWAPPPPVASWAATPRPDAPWSPLQEARPGAKPLAKMKRRGITMMPLGSKRARA